jgi:hypothetical protein
MGILHVNNIDCVSRLSARFSISLANLCAAAPVHFLCHLGGVLIVSRGDKLGHLARGESLGAGLLSAVGSPLRNLIEDLETPTAEAVSRLDWPWLSRFAMSARVGLGGWLSDWRAGGPNIKTKRWVPGLANERPRWWRTRNPRENQNRASESNLNARTDTQNRDTQQESRIY